MANSLEFHRPVNPKNPRRGKSTVESSTLSVVGNLRQVHSLARWLLSATNVAALPCIAKKRISLLVVYLSSTSPHQTAPLETCTCGDDPDSACIGRHWRDWLFAARR